jgi:hypothetical protein
LISGVKIKIIRNETMRLRNTKGSLKPSRRREQVFTCARELSGGAVKILLTEIRLNLKIRAPGLRIKVLRARERRPIKIFIVPRRLFCLQQKVLKY